MEYKVLKNKDIDKSRWDECVTESTTPDIYALSWYLDCVCPTWQALVFGDYEAVFPICKTYKFGFLPIISVPYLTKDFGIYAKNVDQFLNIEIFCIIRKELKKSIKLKYQIKKNIDLGLKYEIRTKQIIEFENNTTYPGKTLRKSLRDAELNNFELKYDFDSNEVFGFLEKTLIDKKILGNTYLIPYFKKLYNVGYSKGFMFNVALFYEGKLCAVDLYGKCASSIYLIQNAGNEYSKKGGMHFLIFSAIEKFRPEIKIVDFMGSNLEKVILFNKNFCNKEVEYHEI